MKLSSVTFGCLLAVLLGVATAPAQTLLLQYDFDEASSGNANAIDSGIAPAAPGVFQGAATRTANTPAGASLGALDLNTAGAGVFVSGGDADKLDGLASFTLSIWINLLATPTGNLRLMSKQGGGAFPGFSWNISNPVSGTRTASNFGLRTFVGGSTAFVGDGATAPFTIDAANKWAFLAVSYNGGSTANNVNYYIGSDAASVTLAGTTTVNAGTVNASSAIFGVGYTDAAPASDTAPPGFLDDARVYSGLLNTAQLEAVRLENVPEPSTYALFGMAAGAVAFVRRKNRR